jgi:hypothetical protein
MCYEFENSLPQEAGPKSNRPGVKTAETSRGLAKDRFILKYVQEAMATDENGWKLAMQQFAAVTDTGTDLSKLNDRVKEIVQLHVHDDCNAQASIRKGGQSTRVNQKGEPVYDPRRMRDAEVKRVTGFPSLLHLLVFVVIVCDGSIEQMMVANSSLTWFEEWVLYFEFVWGRTCIRGIDAEEKYDIVRSVIRDVILQKLALVQRTVSAWPRYARHEEDFSLRSEAWKLRYGDKRVIFWDNTNLDFLGKPGDPDVQRLTFSSYYGGNVAKAGVFLQLCGWLGGFEPWTGAISDTDYFERSGILEEQEKFQKWDTSSTLAFTNVLDRGYRCNLAAWRKGGQLLLQPFFAKSDRKFNSREVLVSGAVASHRSANERAVERMKESRLVCRGIHERVNLTTVADVWLAWGFQSNFMFEPVL